MYWLRRTEEELNLNTGDKMIVVNLPFDQADMSFQNPRF